ncbi:hypothetical protein FGO68_gene8297 [Halteria grandinella]|uniref:Uncharacterized protein n=1 Tax=Halteria grandinella TaxID=5974 RepID=A0A8J8NNK4_HALGN|nr:hypothetical protein FGO68_gene8297 [Halteria grandinella]
MKFGLQKDESSNQTIKFDSKPQEIEDIKSFKQFLLNLDKPLMSQVCLSNAEAEFRLCALTQQRSRGCFTNKGESLLPICQL